MPRRREHFGGIRIPYGGGIYCGHAGCRGGEDSSDDDSDYTDTGETGHNDEEPERRRGRRGGGRRPPQINIMQGDWGGMPPYEVGYGGSEQYGDFSGEFSHPWMNHYLADTERRIQRLRARNREMAADLEARRQALDGPQAQEAPPAQPAQPAQPEQENEHGRQEQEQSAFEEWRRLEGLLWPEWLRWPEWPYPPEGWGVDDGERTPEQLAQMMEISQRMRERGFPGW